MEVLVDTCPTQKGREELAEKAVISDKLILKCANHAALARVKEIGVEFVIFEDRYLMSGIHYALPNTEV